MPLWEGPVQLRSEVSRHVWRDCYLVLSTSALKVFKSRTNSNKGNLLKDIETDHVLSILSPEKGKGGACRLSISIRYRESLELIVASPEEAQTLLSWGTALKIARAQQRLEPKDVNLEVDQKTQFDAAEQKQIRPPHEGAPDNAVEAKQPEADQSEINFKQEQPLDDLKEHQLEPETTAAQFQPQLNRAESKFSFASSVSSPSSTKALTAIDFHELIEAKQRDYLAGTREWLFQQVREWLSDQSNSMKRLFYLVGGAGTGKSVVSAQLLRTKGVCEHVKAWHFCRHDDAAGSAVRVILQSWAAMLAENVPGLKLLQAPGELEKALSAATANEMFELLIAAPLRQLAAAEQDEKAEEVTEEEREHGNIVTMKVAGNVEQAHLPPVTPPHSVPPCVIVLDALDELPQDSVQDVLQLITEEFGKLPSFVRLFVASRDEAEISERLEQFEHVKLEVNEFHNRADLKMYLTAVARRHVHLELSMEDFERELELEFSLAPLTLQGELKSLEPLFQQSKNLYAAAVAPFDPSPSSVTTTFSVSTALGVTDEIESYRELCEVADIQPQFDPIRQYSDSLEQLYEDAKEAHAKLRSLFASEWKVWKTVDEGKTVLYVPVEGNAAEWVDVVIDPGLKSLESASRKIRTDYKGDASRTKDLVRFTAQFTDCVRMKQFLEKLQQRSVDQQAGPQKVRSAVAATVVPTRVPAATPALSVLSLKNKYSNPSALGYRDVNVTLAVRLANGRSHVCELQVNLEEMLKAKEQAHKLYEQARVLLPVVCDRAGLSSQVQKAQFEASLTKLLRSSVLETAVRELERKAGGLFLYASLLARHLDIEYQKNVGKKVDFAALRGLPSGLAEIYEENFGRIVHSAEEWAIYSRLIALIIAAREPLPSKLAQEMIGNGYIELERALSVLFPVREGRFQVMHKSVADWLQESGRVGKKDFETSHRSMGLHLWQLLHCTSLGSPSSSSLSLCVPFCVRHVVYHLCCAGLWKEAFQSVSDLKWLLARAEQDVLGLVVDLEHAASFSSSPHQPTIRLMAQALRMDLVNELYYDYRSVPTRLVGRLMGHDSREVKQLLEKLRGWEGPPEGWWCPVQPTMQPVGGALLATCNFPFKITSVQWGPDQTLAIACGHNVKLWNLENGKCIRTLEGHSNAVTSVSWSSDGQRICSGSGDTTARVWEVSSGKCIQTLKGHSLWMTSVSWSSDGRRICSGSNDKTVRVWEVSSGKCIRTLEGHSYAVNSVSWSSDGQRICSGDGWDKTVRVWDVSSGKCIRTLEGHSNRVNSVSWSSDGQRICSGSDDKTVRVWDVSSGKCIRTLEGHSSGVTSVSWSSDGQRICSGGGWDNTVRVWDVSSGKCIRTLEGHSNWVNSVSWCGDDRRLCSGSWDNRVSVWEVSCGKWARTLEGHSNAVTSISWSSDGQRICSGSNDGTARVWEVSSGKCIQTLEGHSSWMTSVSWSSDGLRICSGSNDKTVRVWQVSSGKCVRTLEGHSYTVTSVSWSSDGRRICSGSDDNTVRVWEVSSGKCIRTLEGHSYAVNSVSWSSDGQRICSGSDDRTVRVWEVSSGNCIQTLEGHSNRVNSVSWSSDGRRICSGSDNVKVWDVSSGECTRTFGSDVNSVSWSSDGQRICICSSDWTQKVWEVSSCTIFRDAARFFWNSGPSPVGFNPRFSGVRVSHGNPALAVIVEDKAIHCLRRLGHTRHAE